MKRRSFTRIDEIYTAICDVFRQYNVTEQELKDINKELGIQYILSLKKRMKIIKPENKEAG